MSTALSTTVLEKEISYVPFGADASDPSNAIKLSVGIIKQFVSVRTKSGAVCDDQQAMKFLLLCKAKKLNPFEGDCFLVGYDGKDGPQFSLITAHQAFLKRAELNLEFDGMLSGVLVREKDGTLREQEGDFHTSDQTLVGGWAKVFFKNRKYPMFKKLALVTFRKPFGVWNSDPAGMIVKCAEADALRSAFPTMLGGLYMQQEIEAHQTEVTVMPATRSRLVAATQAALPPASTIVVSGSSAAPLATPLSTGSSLPVEAPREEPTPAAAPKRGRPSSSAVVPAPVAAPEPEPYVAPPGDPEPEAGDPFAAGTAPEAVEGEVSVKPLTPSEDPAETTATIRMALKSLDLTEAELLEWCQHAGLSKPSQTFISQLAGTKLETLCQQWPKIIADLKAPV